MDSANSGSLQSSSGGDEEYDSRAADAFINSTAPPFFDPLSAFLLNPGPTRHMPNYLAQDAGLMSHALPTLPTFQTPPPPPAAAALNTTAARGSKKRSRASRRAPTTVLTTDTSNFRAMVQEFTGIPSAPFSNPPYARNRLDLFSTRSATPPPYLRRPFPQKLPPPPSLLNTTTTTSSYQIPIPQNPKSPFPKFGGLDEQFGSNTLANLIQSDQIGTASNEAYSFGRNYHGGKGAENVESWICSSE